jgi:hypothetical protein
MMRREERKMYPDERAVAARMPKGVMVWILIEEGGEGRALIPILRLVDLCQSGRLSSVHAGPMPTRCNDPDVRMGLDGRHGR